MFVLFQSLIVYSGLVESCITRYQKLIHTNVRTGLLPGIQHHSTLYLYNCLQSVRTVFTPSRALVVPLLREQQELLFQKFLV